MKEGTSGGSRQRIVGTIIFLCGFVPALIFGWLIFPNLLYSKHPQPMEFSHLAHEDMSCEDCHSVREDGTYSGIPKVASCAECHESPIGESKAEKTLVEEYIEKEREIPWKIYAWQPDNVYFSHAPHLSREVACTECHRDVSGEEKLPPYRENRITGYSKETMKMITCERCHEKRGASNECEICHK